MSKIDIRSMYLPELENYLSEMGEPHFRAKQIFHWLQSGVTDFDEMTDISKALRERLKADAYIAGAETERRYASRLDETVKYVFRLFDGELIETVLMKYEHGYTVCISTQVGCRMGCKFCASGINGLTRSLTASEMLAQITAVQRDNNIRVSNIVMMGMGEPLDNFDNSVRFLKLVSDGKGLNRSSPYIPFHLGRGVGHKKAQGIQSSHNAVNFAARPERRYTFFRNAR